MCIRGYSAPPLSRTDDCSPSSLSLGLAQQHAYELVHAYPMVIYTSELASILPIPEITLPEYMLSCVFPLSPSALKAARLTRIVCSNPFGVEKDRVIILGLEGRSLTFGVSSCPGVLRFQAEVRAGSNTATVSRT